MASPLLYERAQSCWVSQFHAYREMWTHFWPVEDCGPLKESLLLAFKSPESPCVFLEVVRGKAFNMNYLEILIFGVTGKQPALETCLQKALGREEVSLSGWWCPQLERPESRLSKGWGGDVSGGQAGPAKFPRISSPSMNTPPRRMLHIPPIDSSSITEFIVSSALKSSMAHCCLFTLDNS